MEREGFTLTELIVAVSLLEIVVVAVAGIDLASRRSLLLASRRARVQDEVRYAMEHMVRNIRLGNKIRPTSGTDLTNVWVRVDRDVDGYPQNSPDNTNDDTWVRYDFIAADYEIKYVPPQTDEPDVLPGTEVPIAKDIYNLDFDIVDQLFLTIDLTAAYDPSTYNPSTVDPNNPGVTLHAGVTLRCKAKD